ncbi:MAG: hypothetical protein JWP58_1790 [Hymenobacter sp.]|nr:hypothetical protein [Hymenobacter sp.]
MTIGGPEGPNYGYPCTWFIKNELKQSKFKGAMLKAADPDRVPTI